MNDFIKIKASNDSLSMRRLIHGVAINDAWFQVQPTINGKQVVYTPYRTWKNMLERCYSSNLKKNRPTYKGCTVCKEWLTFSNFEKWMLAQDWQGMALDKDIIKQGNKLYCTEYCMFVSPVLNNLLIGSDAARGDYPMGVCWDKQRKKYLACIRIKGKNKYLGRFKTVQEAKAVYDNAKYSEIRRQAIMQDDLEIKAGLMNWVVE